MKKAPKMGPTKPADCSHAAPPHPAKQGTSQRFFHALTACTLALSLLAQAHAQATPAAPLPELSPAGQGTMRFLGFDVYKARLWVSPGFDPDNYAKQPLALELTYQRNFTAQAIAKRSLQEMRRVGTFTDEQASHWQQTLQAALPDVQPGDSITGVLQPGVGAIFKSSKNHLGEVKDPEFARLFFGIWLSARTSEPQLRAALLPAQPAAPP